MTANQAKNLVGDLLQAGATVRIQTDGQGGWIVYAEPSNGQEVSAAQVHTLADRYTVTAIVPSATFR